MDQTTWLQPGVGRRRVFLYIGCAIIQLVSATFGGQIPALQDCRDFFVYFSTARAETYESQKGRAWGMPGFFVYLVFWSDQAAVLIMCEGRKLFVPSLRHDVTP